MLTSVGYFSPLQNVNELHNKVKLLFFFLNARVSNREK